MKKSFKEKMSQIKSGGKITDARIDEVLKHYMIASLWSSTNSDNEEEEFLDTNYDINDIAPESKAKMRADVKKFMEENIEAINESGQSDEMIGHDLWLTRNGHGAGFWDRGLGEVGEKLSEASRKMKGSDLYVGDDKKIHVMAGGGKAGKKESKKGSVRKNYGGGGVVTNIDKAIASSELKEELRDELKKHKLDESKDHIIHFGYTDYGGDFFDKVAIEYFKEKHPKNIVFESTIYNGQNAFVFGEPAKEFAEETAEYPLGYEKMEEYYSNMESEQEREDYKSFIDDLQKYQGYKVKDSTLDWLLENKGGYYSMLTTGLDFSYEQLAKELVKEGLIEKVSDDEMASGGKAGELSKKIKSENKISEKEINLIKNRMNSGKADADTKELVQWIWDNTPELTTDQSKKGLDFLMDQWKTPAGVERKNNPFGFREQKALETFKHFELAGFHDNSRAGQNPYLIPIYNVIGDENNFQYYYDGKVNIIGASGGQMKTGGKSGNKNEISYKGKSITKLFPSGYYEFYSDAQGRFLKFDDLDNAKAEIDAESETGKLGEVKELLRKKKVNPDYVSPNFVSDFASKHGIKLTSEEIVKISDTYSSGGATGVKKKYEFYNGDVVWDTSNKTYGVVLNNFDDAINGDGGDVRLDSDGMQSIYKYDEKSEKRIGYNLVPYGSKEDKGDGDLSSLKKSGKGLIESNKNYDEGRYKYYSLIYCRLLSGEFDKKKSSGGSIKTGGEAGDRMYNFLKDDLVKLEKAIEEKDKEEIDTFFSYWNGDKGNGHLKSLAPKKGSDRMYNFLKDDLIKLEKAIQKNDKEEIDRFFSYWSIHLKSLNPSGGSMATGGRVTADEIIKFLNPKEVLVKSTNHIQYVDKNDKVKHAQYDYKEKKWYNYKDTGRADSPKEVFENWIEVGGSMATGGKVSDRVYWALHNVDNRLIDTNLTIKKESDGAFNIKADDGFSVNIEKMPIGNEERIVWDWLNELKESKIAVFEKGGSMAKGGEITSYRDIPYNEVVEYAYKKGINTDASEQNFKDVAIMLFNEKYAKKSNGGKMPKSTQVKKIATQITALEQSMGSSVTNQFPELKEKMQKKIEDLKKLQHDMSVKISTKQKMDLDNGRFYIEIPTAHKNDLYTKLRDKGIKVKWKSLGDTTRAIANNKAKQAKVYDQYSKLLSRTNESVPSLESISGKISK